MVILWLAGIKTSALVVLALVMLSASGQDPAGRAMAGGVGGFALLYWVLLVLPAVLWARKGRHLRVALALLLLPEPILLLLLLWQVL